MSHEITLLDSNGEEILDLNLSGNFSEFYEFFNASDINRGSNGEGEFKTTFSEVSNFVKQFDGKKLNPHQGLSILVSYLSQYVKDTAIAEGCDPELTFQCY